MNAALFFSSVYVVAIASANLLVAHFGPWFSPINSFLLIGLDLSLRDHLHDRIGLAKVLGLTAIAGIVSYGLNPASATIAVASSLSFVLSNLADASAYQALRGKPWLVRANGSNVAGSAVDSILFPVLAFGALMPQIVVAQFLAKMAGGAAWSFALGKTRA